MVGTYLLRLKDPYIPVENIDLEAAFQAMQGMDFVTLREFVIGLNLDLEAVRPPFNGDPYAIIFITHGICVGLFALANAACMFSVITAQLKNNKRFK